MSNSKESRESGTDGVTIVGGRPLRRAVPVSELPVGIEQLLTIAALDAVFLERVAADPVAAATARGIRLDGAEVALLRNATPALLRQMAERLVVPRTMDRGTFMKAVAASIVAMVTGNAFLLCSGCTGADTYEYDGGGARQQWVTYGGYTCYLYVPERVDADASRPAPIMVALHGEGETCLSNVQRWAQTADSYGFILLSVNWTEEANTDAGVDELAHVLASLAGIALDRRESAGRFLCSRGIATPLVYRSGFVIHPLAWDGVVMLGGAPDGDWIKEPEKASEGIGNDLPAVYYVSGDADPDFEQAKACVARLEELDVVCEHQIVSGETSGAILEFATIWRWLTEHKR